jgi:hypothetical protein
MKRLPDGWTEKLDHFERIDHCRALRREMHSSPKDTQWVKDNARWDDVRDLLLPSASDYEPIKRINPETQKPFKSGDLRADGYRFREYTTRVNSDGTRGEIWMNPKVYARIRGLDGH